jgi:hypothetical protein
MKKFVFEYKEVCRGTIEVFAFDEDEAREKAECLDGNVYINKSQEDIGALIIATDVEFNN